VKRVLIVGLGRIGMGYDLSIAGGRRVETHASAFSAHEAFELVGGVDPDASCRRLFERTYRQPSYGELEPALRSVSADVVVIAVPTAYHRPTIEAILKVSPPEAILCEKPLSFLLNDARIIVDLCKRVKTKLFVNYVRRCDPGINIVRVKITRGELRGPVEGVVRYANGLLNSGSHFVNLMEYWLGPVLSGELIREGKTLGSGDTEADILLRFVLGNVMFQSPNTRGSQECSVNLRFNNGCLEYDRRQSEIMWKTQHSEDGDEPRLFWQEEIIKNDSARYQWYVADELVKALNGASSNICSGDAALMTLMNIASVFGGKRD